MKTRRKILVVDHDLMVRDQARAVLEHAGYEVTTAHDGQQAIQLIASADYDVVMLDAEMGVVGDLIERNDPVLAHTYLLTVGDTQPLYRLPVCGVIGKPFDMRSLVEEAKDCIGH
jgi:DNA-binding response OmpR family regulator